MEIKNKGLKNPDIRFLSDMKEVLYDRKWSKKVSNFPFYYMYRGKRKKGELRYDITIIPPIMLGKEFPKTLGHKHLGSCRELYQVLKGKAFFLFQKTRNNRVIEVTVIKAKRDEIAIIPQGCSHITINPSKEVLKLSNWVPKKCRNDYKPIKKLGGGCYYYTKSGWIKNKNYKKIPKLKFEKPLKEMPKNLDFLRGENLPRW